VIRATLDTNTLASGALARTGTIAQAIGAWRRELLDIVMSEHILRELERALHKPYFTARLAEPDREEFLSLLRRFGTVVNIEGPIPTVCATTADNLVLATVLTAGTSSLVSSDRELQELTEFQGVRVVSARQMLDILLAANADHE
jgi:putative PIN family toxin of toxin-antitoxin system